MSTSMTIDEKKVKVHKPVAEVHKRAWVKTVGGAHYAVSYCRAASGRSRVTLAENWDRVTCEKCISIREGGMGL